MKRTRSLVAFAVFPVYVVSSAKEKLTAQRKPDTGERWALVKQTGLKAEIIEPGKARPVLKLRLRAESSR